MAVAPGPLHPIDPDDLAPIIKRGALHRPEVVESERVAAPRPELPRCVRRP
jgi:hypothetical protein